MVMPRRRFAWPLAGAIYLLLSLAFGAIVYLGTRHHPIAHQRFATVVLPGAFVVTAFMLLAFLVNRRLSAMPAWLALDLLAWLPLLVLTLGARSGRANVALWVGVAITLKAAALLIALGRAVAESRIGDRTAAWLLVAISILFYVAPLLAMAAVAGRTVREMFLGARALGADPVAALTAASLVGFSLPFAVFATQVYPEIPGAFLTAFAARQLLAAPAGRRVAALIT